jgi:hypothetical protein
MDGWFAEMRVRKERVETKTERRERKEKPSP